MSHPRARSGEPSVLLTCATIVVALGVALALLVAFAGPKNVRRTSGNAGFAIGACGASEPKGGLTGVITNTDDHAAQIVAIEPSAGSSNVAVRDFAAIDAGHAGGHLDPETVMAWGASRVPTVAHPREILPGHQAIVQVLMASGRRPSHLTGYDITIADGPVTHVVHDEADVSFTGACNATV